MRLRSGDTHLQTDAAFTEHHAALAALPWSRLPIE